MKFVPNKVTRTVSRQILKTKKNSPHIFFIGGVAGIIGATALACRATLHVGDSLDELNADLKEVKTGAQTRINSGRDDYSESDYYKDLGYVYAKGGVNIVRLYSPAIIIGGVSIAALTGSHIQLTRRNTALTAALTTVSAAYEKYRERVREELGVDKELDIYYSARKEAVENSDGTKSIAKIADGEYSVYARCFDESNPNYQKHSDYNKMFVMAQQNYINHKLEAHGHVFLNEVYDMFGFERTSAGAVVGWLFDDTGNGDGYIDFGLYEAHNADFVAGREKAIWLDFNVDGVIYDLI